MEEECDTPRDDGRGPVSLACCIPRYFNNMDTDRTTARKRSRGCDLVVWFVRRRTRSIGDELILKLPVLQAWTRKARGMSLPLLSSSCLPPLRQYDIRFETSFRQGFTYNCAIPTCLVILSKIPGRVTLKLAAFKLRQSLQRGSLLDVLSIPSIIFDTFLPYFRR